MSSRRLAELRAPQITESISSTSVMILPVGAVEQHGPHLPLDTDLVIAETVAERAVAAVLPEVDAWLLPALAVSKSNEHSWSPGTLWLGPETLLAVIGDIARSMATTAARRLVLFNGHGGNSSLLSVALREVRLATGLMTFLAHPSVPPDQGGTSGDATSELGMGIHGGADETSMMMYLRPDSVDMTAARRNVPDHLATNQMVRFGGSVGFGWLSNDFGPDGHIGDPTVASVERGEALVSAAVDGFARALREIAVFRF